ncbi:MAG TPA: DEAD/DEAH box helicase [Oscillatoriaceae cyanobacterium M33_DOE_052]|uniref:DEAD/DEAH box helicase n=1 Tax=Planktothricoides sp. SpSt-374 TaxID=2282167 RepID=A0A7C3ZQM0_9CYAN|nr:DEAD/DEAH box helicase [Oscillatoriaceae cyanobacterium M33_DOE_052]
MLSTEIDPKTVFPFALDDFQNQAIDALNAGKSVVVCAPTGSGKTLIGEYAIHRALYSGGRVFYTTPLKALSNQKFRDFRHQFGAEKVGLLTGDSSINREAAVLVMTTEIFRNMLYGTAIGAVGTSLDGVEAVVLDECHYMNDRQRGTVWEESIIYCPPEIQVVALSATVANSQQLTDWICRVHGPTELIYSEYRPVPLQYHFCSTKGLFALLDGKGQKINPKLKALSRGRKGREDAPSLTFVMTQLWQKDMLPAIYFIFSRRGCDKSVEDLLSQDVNLVNDREARLIEARVEEFLAANPELARASQVRPVLRGIASHHAGILPTWKAFVEELFQDGLIKVVFATETLAAGINMPARTTVISSLSKRTDDGHRLLTASEFLQMAGRAGRRGMDKVGHLVTLQTRFEGAKEAAFLATAGADPLVSQFTPTYGMVLNLLQTHNLEETKELVESSFGQYLATLQVADKIAAIEESSRRNEQLLHQLSNVDDGICRDYEQKSHRLKEANRFLKTAETNALEASAAAAVLAIPVAQPGDVLSLKGPNVHSRAPISAVLVQKLPGSGQFPYLVCLGQDNRWYVVSSSDVVATSTSKVNWGTAGAPPIPDELIPKPGQHRQGKPETAKIAALLPSLPSPLETDSEVLAQQQRVAALEAQLEAHPIHQWGDPSTLLKRQRKAEELQEEISKNREKVARYLGRYWEEFLDLIQVLVEIGGLVPTGENDTLQFSVSEMGESVAAIRGDNELWLGLALMSGWLERLDPHQFAAVCAALVTEVSRPNTWTRYELSEEVDRVLSGLQGIRRKLFQVQHRHDVALPVWLERDLIAIVEQWALGVEWFALCAETSLDEGDVVRILRRTLDFLSQIPHVPHISDDVRANAYRAMALIDRFPVNETLE